MIGLPSTVSCLPHALRSALSALHQGEVQSRVLWVRILYSWSAYPEMKKPMAYFLQS